MKVQYNLKTITNNAVYVADLTLKDLNSDQLEFIRTLLHDVTKYNKLFTKSDRDELSGQKIVDHIALQLEK